MALSPIREFALKALLWLPLSFVLWFVFASPLVWPVMQIAKGVLLSAWPQLFSDLSQGAAITDIGNRVIGNGGYLITLTTQIIVNTTGADGKAAIGLLEPTLNPLIYGYSLPLFSGLAMATPVTMRRRLLQFAIALCVIWLAQAFGVVCESLKFVAFDAGQPGIAAMAKVGISAEVIALAYQFGYLILPAVVPVALWIGLNRDFIENLIQRPREPLAVKRGPSVPGSEN